MSDQSLIHVPGCWVSQPLPSGDKSRRGVVRLATSLDSGVQLQVQWLIPEKVLGTVSAKQVNSGFQNGMDVQDATPVTGVRSLGIGSIMQQRNLADSQQVLVDFPESGERRWLPYQHLRQVKGAKLDSSLVAQARSWMLSAYAYECWPTPLKLGTRIPVRFRIWISIRCRTRFIWFTIFWLREISTG